MIKFRKIALELNDEQKEHLDFILSGLDFLYNYYIMYNKKLYYENKDTHEGYTFITDTEFNHFVARELSLCDEYRWIREIHAQTRDEIIHRCFNAYKRFFNKKANPPKLKTAKNKTRTCYIRRGGLNFNKDFTYIKIPSFESPIKVIDVDYIRNFKFNRIISASLSKRTHDKIFIILKCETDDEYMINKKAYLTNKISISMGMKRYITIYDGNKLYHINNDILTNQKIKNIEDRINKIYQIIDKKVKFNKIRKRFIGNPYKLPPSKRINNLYEKIRKLYFKKENIINDFIYKVINKILVLFKPKILILDNNQIIKLLMSIDDKEFCHQLQNNKFYFFKSRLIDYCKQYGCEVRTAKKKDTYFKTCSKCGYVIDDIDIQNNYFECPKCESLIYKNDNNAINLYKIENYNIK